MAYRIGPDINPSLGGEQAQISVARLKEAGVDFFATKISEGIGFARPASRSMEMIRRAIEIDLPAIAYHFAWGNDVGKQVGTFISSIGSDRLARRIGLCLDVESYNGQVAPRRAHVLGWYREIARRLGKDLIYFVYSGDWYWKARIDRPGEKPVLQILEEEGIHVKLWSTPDSGYFEGANQTITDTAAGLPLREFQEGFSGKPATIVQVDDTCRVAGYHPLDGNVTQATVAEIKKFCNWSAS